MAFLMLLAKNYNNASEFVTLLQNTVDSFSGHSENGTFHFSTTSYLCQHTIDVLISGIHIVFLV